MSIIETLTSLFAPNECLSCGREDKLLCNSCVAQLPVLPGRCFRCYGSLTSRSASCADCLRAAGFGMIHAVAGYTGVTKEVLRQLKFQGNQSAAKLMAQLMVAERQIPRTAILTHIPATTRHIRQRGYDQSELIARIIGQQAGCQHPTLIARHGQHHQLGSSRSSRVAQLESAFRITQPRDVQGRHIILIDDVITTGSSLTVACQVLRAAGATRVDAIVFAQA